MTPLTSSRIGRKAPTTILTVVNGSPFSYVPKRERRSHDNDDVSIGKEVLSLGRWGVSASGGDKLSIR